MYVFLYLIAKYSQFSPYNIVRISWLKEIRRSFFLISLEDICCGYLLEAPLINTHIICLRGEIKKKTKKKKKKNNKKKNAIIAVEKVLFRVMAEKYHKQFPFRCCLLY